MEAASRLRAVDKKLLSRCGKKASLEEARKILNDVEITLGLDVTVFND